MPGYLFPEQTYCALCDKYFTTYEAREEHVQWSSRHPQCEPCQRRFPNKNALRTHYSCSKKHRYCLLCDKAFSTEGGYKVHLEASPKHRTPSVVATFGPSSFDQTKSRPEGWEDECGKKYFPNDGPTDEEDDVEYEEFWEEDEEEDEEDECVDSLESVPPTTEGGIDLLMNAIRNKYSHVRTLAELAQYNDRSRAGPLLPEALYRRAVSVKLTCPICLAGPSDSCSTLKCGHLFCTSCVEETLEQDPTCPVCSEPANATHLIEVKPCVV